MIVIHEISSFSPTPHKAPGPFQDLAHVWVLFPHNQMLSCILRQNVEALPQLYFIERLLVKSFMARTKMCTGLRTIYVELSALF